MKIEKLTEGNTGGTLGDRIRRARHERNLSLESLAEKLGVSKVSVWSWEMNRSRPRLALLSSLSDALGMSPEALLKGDSALLDKGDIAALVADCQRRIGLAVGTSPEQVGIVISFGTAVSQA